jgi:putative tryptophan/tyrosine transport system substrate-binding protein
MNRRAFITAFGGVAAFSLLRPLVTHAQHAERPKRIGWLVGLPEEDPEVQRRKTALIGALQDLGWTVGRNLQIDYRYTSNGQTLDTQAPELIALSPDLLIANSTPGTRALQQATGTIPIVFAGLVDPVASGVVANLARPGGNVTGFMSFEASIGAKWLELLKRISPATGKVALIFNQSTAPYQDILRSIEAAAPGFGITITARGVADADRLGAAIAAAGRENGAALIVFPDITNTAHFKEIVTSAAQAKVPAVYPYRFFTTGGGLMSYGAETPDLMLGLAGYIDRILKGTKAGELPVQAPDKFQLVINTKTAKALGLNVPDSLLALADEVIE